MTASRLLAPIAYDRARVFAPMVFLLLGGWVVSLAFAGRLAPVVIVFTAAMSLVTGAIAAVTQCRRGAKHGHVIIAILWWAPTAATLCAALDHLDPVYAMTLPVTIAGAGVLLTPRFMTGSLCVVLSIWIPLSLQDSSYVIYIATVVTAAAVSLTQIHASRRALLGHAIVADALRCELAERARLEEQLLHSQRMEAVGTLAAGLAHDMNNVLASIMSFADFVAAEPLNTRAREDIEQVRSQSARGAALTRSLLAFSRGGQYRKEVVEINDIVSDVLQMLSRTLPQTIAIRTDLHAAKGWIEGDRVQLGQSLINLALNAVDAMAGAGTLTIVTDHVHLDNAACGASDVAPGRYVLLSLADTGTGMDATTRRKVFEPFFTTKPTGKGTGLGLAAVWGIVQAHRGLVAVESEPGQGAKFSIHLPLAVAPPPGVHEPAAQLPRPSTQRVARVLVVDDEPAVRAGVSRILQKMGCSVVEASNGREALDLLATPTAGEFGLVITDMCMPVMHGAEFFRRLRQTNSVPVLVSTGYASDTEVQELVACGATVIEKPFTQGALVHEVTRLLHEDSRPSGS